VATAGIGDCCLLWKPVQIAGDELSSNDLWSKY
jgi:hypothetical protein